MERIVAEIIEKDRELQLASRSYDVATIQKLISQDFILISSSRKVYDADAFMRDVVDRSVLWFANDTEEAYVRPYGDSCAVITAVLHSVFEHAEGVLTSGFALRIHG